MKNIFANKRNEREKNKEKLNITLNSYKYFWYF